MSTSNRSRLSLPPERNAVGRILKSSSTNIKSVKQHASEECFVDTNSLGRSPEQVMATPFTRKIERYTCNGRLSMELVLKYRPAFVRMRGLNNGSVEM